MKRVVLFKYIIIISFVLLLARAFYIQVIKHEKYLSEVEELQTKVVEIPSIRGKIYDRNGKLLAWTETLYVIKKLRELKESELEEIKNVLSKNFSNTTTLLDKLIFQGKITLKLSSAAIRKLEEIKGINIIERKIRKYKDISLFHILGYINVNGEPVGGIEKSYNKYLEGQEGIKFVKLYPSGKIKKVLEYIDPLEGNNIYLTIDYDLQRYIYELLELENKPSAVVVSDPNTGEILALVSYPSVDPNKFSIGMSVGEWRKLLYSKDKPLVNRAMLPFSPGSVIKPFYALIALQENYITPEATIDCKGKYSLYNSEGKEIGRYYDWNIFGHGITDLIKAIRVSCNIYFYQLGQKMGIELMSKYANLYKIDKKTGIDIPGEKSGIFPSPSWKKEKFNKDWYPGETILTSIGQGYINLTPLEILRIFNILAENGYYYKFHLLKAIGTDLTGFSFFNPPILDFFVEINPETLKVIKEGMVQVTSFPGNAKNGGTAYRAFKNLNITVAGKTGTAEVYGGKSPHSWFAGFSPAEKPKVSVVVFVENGGYGSETAAPIARKIFEKLKELGYL